MYHNDMEEPNLNRKRNKFKDAARVISLELKKTTTPPLARKREEYLKNDYILGHIQFLHLDSSDMGHREREFALINHDEDPCQTLEYVTRKWNLGAPKLVISLVGGFRKIKHMTASVKNTFRRELVNSILSTGAWLTTGGLHSGMIRDVGETLREHAIGRAMAEHRSVVVLGIAPLSILKHKQKLTSSQVKPIKYKIDPSDATTAQLDPNHTHFIVVNDEGMDRTGAEIDTQMKLLQEISGRMIEGSSTAGIPVVCIVIGGGYRRIKAVHQAVVENNIPVIILAGTGGAADLLAYASKNMNAKDAINKNGGLTWSLTASLSRAMASTITSFNKIVRREFGQDKIDSIGDCLIEWCREIAERKDLITVLSLNSTHSDIEETILHSLLKASLSRAISNTTTSFNKIVKREFGQDKIDSIGDCLIEWCREIAERKDLITVLSLNSTHSDIEETILHSLLKAKSGSQYEDQLHLAAVLDRIELAQKLLKDETSLSSTTVRQTLRFALINDQVKFVKLFLKKGLVLQDYLTRRELTSLYKMTKKDTLLFELLDYELECRGRQMVDRWINLRDVGNVILKLTDDSYQPLYLKEDIADHTYGFPNPSRELFLWAVLQGRLEMADLFWRESKAPIGGALLASKLLKEMAKKERSSHETRRVTQYEEGGSSYEKLAVGVLDECYLSDRKRTSLIIVRKLTSWGNSNCLDLANGASNMKFIAHPSVQNMLTEFWMGKLSLSNPVWKIVLGIAFPPALLFVRVKLKEEEADPLLVKSLPRGTSKGTILIRKPVRRSSTLVNVRSRRWLPSLFPRGISRDDTNDDEDRSNARGNKPVSELNRRKAVKMDQSVRKKDKKNENEVSRWRRIQVFFLVPKVIFFYNVLSTFAFLAIFSYVLLKSLDDPKPTIVEKVLLVWFVTLCAEIIRQIHGEDAKGFKQRFRQWITYFWNMVDIAKSIIFIIGYVLRFIPDHNNAARIVLAIALIFFYMRLLHIFSANKHLGPKLIMIQKMFADLLVFLCILLVFLIAYGVSSEAILHPHRQNLTTVAVFESVLYRPYIQMFGEGLLEDADNSECWEDINGGEDCPENVWFGTILLAIYLFLSNVLLLNLLIAMFNYTFTAVQENTDVYWKYQRYLLIKEYYKRPFLPPPFIIIIHVWQFFRVLFKSLISACKKCRRSINCACCKERKVFNPDLPPLTQASLLEMATWESVKGEDYLAKQRELAHQNMDKRLKQTDRKINELTENVVKMAQDMSSINEKLETMQTLLLEKLGPPKAEADEIFDCLPDGPTLALYEKSGRRSSRDLTPHAQKMWRYASKLTLAKEAKKTDQAAAAKMTNGETTEQTSLLPRQNPHEVVKATPHEEVNNGEIEEIRVENGHVQEQSMGEK